MTSRAVVNRVQRVVRPAKCGHAGTLDPLATGVLVVCVGPATRLIEYVQRMDKRYRGEFLLGHRSNTLDTDGMVEEVMNSAIPSRQQLEATLPQFVGMTQQQPPAHSALRVNGRRAYDLARKGEPVDLAPRPVRIEELQLVRYEYPRVVLDVTCGSGTYIRALGRDIAERLGTAAVMCALERVAIGHFELSDALSADEIHQETVAQALLSPLQGLQMLPMITVTPDEARRVRQGQAIAACAEFRGEVVARDGDGKLVAILRSQHQRLQPTRSFPA